MAMTEKYVVKAGDTVQSISESYGLTADQLLMLNPSMKKDRVLIGEQLIVPRRRSAKDAPSASQDNPVPTKSTPAAVRPAPVPVSEVHTEEVINSANVKENKAAVKENNTVTKAAAMPAKETTASVKTTAVPVTTQTAAAEKPAKSSAPKSAAAEGVAAVAKKQPAQPQKLASTVGEVTQELVDAPDPEPVPVDPLKKKYTITYKEYKVKRKDTLYSLAKANGVTVDEIVAANPSLKEKGGGLKKGTVIRIPVKTPVPVPKYVGLTDIKIAIVLPIVGSEMENQRSLEFYRGILMGLDEAKDKGLNITVSVFNEPGVNEGIAQTVNQITATEPDLIIGPLYPSHFGDVAAAAKKRTKVIIPFSSKVPQVSYTPHLYVVNTPATYESSIAVDLFISSFKKTTRVVILRSENGDKRAFTQELEQRLRTAGYSVWVGSLKNTPAQIYSGISAGAADSYVLLSDHTDTQTLKDLLQKEEQLRKLMPKASFSLLGYDGWLKQSEGELKKKMHEANTYLLASNYFYPYTMAARSFRNEYEQWFNASLIDCSPRMAPLGYDLIKSFVGGLSVYGYDYATQSPQKGSLSDGGKLQTNPQFVSVGTGGGYVSRSMWLVHFKPDMTIVKINN